MLCSITGAVAKEPVISVKSGHVYEKKLVAKVIKDTGLCPMTNEPLSMDDLIDIKNGHINVVKSETATSVPGLLTLLQNEWDAVALELFQVKKTLQETRQELSHALYQHDAATRVIARLIRERDEYRTRMEEHAKEPKEPVEEEAPRKKKAKKALDDYVLDKMTNTSKELSGRRKKREISPNVATVEDITGFEARGAFPVHATRKGGILCVEPCLRWSTKQHPSITLTGGGDSTVHVVDCDTSSSLVSLKGHTKKVNSVACVGDDTQKRVLSGSADGTVRVWNVDYEGSSECISVLEDAAEIGSTGKKAKSAEVVSVQVHPSGDYFFTACSDGAWSLYDLEKQERLVRVGPETPCMLSAAALHPDGLIYCTGIDDVGLKLWEAKSQQHAASLSGHTGKVHSLSFSENGYYLASAGTDGVKIWDLRKLKSIQSLTPFGDDKGATSVSFDTSGLYLGVGGPSAAIYGVKKDWSIVKTFEDMPKKGVHAVAWGQDARQFVVGAADHNLRLYS
jgi:pre-mRNA-processing factor 19